MNDAVTVPLVTTDDLLAMPEDDGVERELIRGCLIEHPLTAKTPESRRVSANLVYLLHRWLAVQRDRKWRVLGTEPLIRLSHDPETLLNADVAVVPAEAYRRFQAGSRVLDAVPSLAVKVLQPSISAGT